MVKYCPKCGYPNPDDANYCINCGYSLVNIQQKNIIPRQAYENISGFAINQNITDSQKLQNNYLYGSFRSSYQNQSINDQYFIKGIRRIRFALLFQFIGSILLIIGSIILFVLFGLLHIELLSINFAGIILLIIEIIMGLISIIIYILGFNTLSEIDDYYDEGLLGSIFLFIPILNLVGMILLGLSIRHLGKQINNRLLSIGGLLMATILLSSIGAILAFIGAQKIKV